MTARLVGLGVAVALLLAACGAGAPSPSAVGSPAASLAPAASPALPISTPAPDASAAVPSGSPPAGTTTTRDPGLLALLPSTVGGVAVTEEPQSFPEAVADPAFVANVDRAAFPIAVSGSDLTSGVIAHLRPGVYSDAMFADWRATYDNGACQQSGNVIAHAQEDANGRTTYVTTCAGGLRVYHTYLPSRGVIVSLLSTGPVDLGGQLMAGVKG